MTSRIKAALAATAFCACAAGSIDNAYALSNTTTPQASDSPAPSDYVIGPEDQLSIVYFSNKDMSADVVVRSDGKITLPLLNDVMAAGLTPEALRTKIVAEARRFVQDPNPTVVVRQINSRKVFITGAVEKPGSYALAGPTTVLQLIATAAGLKEYADSKNIVIIRDLDGQQTTLSFNYKDVVARRNMAQNILLRPGDTVVVP